MYTHKCVFNEGNAKYLHTNELHRIWIAKKKETRTQQINEHTEEFSETLPFRNSSPHTLKTTKRTTCTSSTQKAFRNEGIYLIFLDSFLRYEQCRRILSSRMYFFFVGAFDSYSVRFWYECRWQQSRIGCNWMTAWLLLASSTIARESIRSKVNKWQKMKAAA